MRSRGLLLLLIVAIGAGAAYWYLGRPADGGAAGGTTEYTSKHGDSVTVTEPVSGATITSPLTVSGIVPGPWSFEASFPVVIQDANHKTVAEGYGKVIGDWMTEKPVKFTATVPFKAPITDKGFIVISKANASGDEATKDSVEVPVRFGS